MNEKPSEMITAFLDFLETTKREYESAYAAVGAEDNKVQTFLHDMEFAKNRDERNRIATKLQNSRKTRRKAKDKVQLYENTYNFFTSKQNQSLIKTLRNLQNEQNTMERYLFGKREFKNRVD